MPHYQPITREKWPDTSVNGLVNWNLTISILNDFLLLYLFLLGCKGAQVEEIWSMEPENFDNLKYVLTWNLFVLLFKVRVYNESFLFQTSSRIDFPLQVAAR